MWGRGIKFRWLYLVIVLCFLANACGGTASPTQPPSTLPTARASQTGTITPISSETASPTPDKALAFIRTQFADYQTNVVLRETQNFITRLTPSATKTRTPTATLTPTATAVPPLKPHTWIPDLVLVQIAVGGGDGGPPGDFPPDLILYYDGLLIRSGEKSFYSYQPTYTYLSRKETCQVLNTIDQIGFLEYGSPAFYEFPTWGAPSRTVEVNAWRSTTVHYPNYEGIRSGDPYEFECDDSHCIEQLRVVPALRKTYDFLASYDPGGWKYYRADKLLVWVFPRTNDPPTEIKDWPLKSLSIQELFLQSGVGEYYGLTILEGEIAQEWQAKVQNGSYSQGDLTAHVYARPLLPYEEFQPVYSYTVLPGPNAPQPTEPLSCKVIDGVLPVPQP